MLSILETISKLENDITSLNIWLNNNHLDLNMDKTEFMKIGSPQNIIKCGDICLNVDGHNILPSESIRILGFILDKHLCFESHIQKVKKNCQINLSPLYHLRQILDSGNISTLIKAMVFPHINYMICIWGATKKSLITQVDSIIRAAARLVMGKRKYDPISEDICTKLRWLMVSELEKKGVLRNMYKWLRLNTIPEFFHNYILTNSDMHGRENRRSSDLRQDTMHTEAWRKSFKYRATKY